MPQCRLVSAAHITLDEPRAIVSGQNAPKVTIPFHRGAKRAQVGDGKPPRLAGMLDAIPMKAAPNVKWLRFDRPHGEEIGRAGPRQKGAQLRYPTKRIVLSAQIDEMRPC